MLLLLGVSAWLVLRQGARSGAPAEALAQVGLEPAPAAATPAPLAREPAPRAEVAEPAPAEEAPPVATAASAPEETLHVVRGTLVVELPDGTRDAASDGSLAFAVHQGSIAVGAQAQVRGGAWSLELGGGALEVLRTGRGSTGPDGAPLLELTVQQVVCRGAAVLQRPVGRVAVPAAGELEVVVRALPLALLRVVDAQSGLDLGDVELAFPTSDLRNQEPHPGLSEARLGRALASPVDLRIVAPQATSVSDVLVGARGYAWRRLPVDFGAGGERSVPLEPGGDLELAFLAPGHRRGVEVRLRREGAREPHASFDLGTRDRALIEGLPAGRYEVRGEVGMWYAPTVLGACEVEVVAGALARGTLALEAAPSATRADASGVVLVPPEWELEVATLNLRFRGTPLDGIEAFRWIPARAAERVDGLDAFPFAFEGLQVGPHELSVSQPEARLAFELPEGGLAGLRLEIPPPCELLVRVVDAASGADVDVEGFGWSAGGPGFGPAQRDEALDRYRIRAPRGELHLNVWSTGYRHQRETVRLDAPRQEHLVRLERATSLVLVLLDRDEPQPLPSDWEAAVTTADGAPALDGTTHELTARTYTLRAGGPHRVVLPPIPGYAPLPDQLLDLPEGETTRLELPLQRTP